MNSRRTAKVAQAVREQVSNSILFDVKDPRVKNVTVLDVEMSPDLQSAKVNLSIMGDEKTQQLCLHGLNSARGFLQSKIADRLQTRYTPILSFVLRDTVKQSAMTSEIFDELQSEFEERASESGDEPNEQQVV